MRLTFQGRARCRLIGKPVFKLFANARFILRLRLEPKRIFPLEIGFELAADLPVSIAEVIVNDSIVRLQLNRTLQMLDSLLKIVLPVIRPTEAIDK